MKTVTSKDGTRIAYDQSGQGPTVILGEEAAIPVERAVRVNVPVLIINGSESFLFMYETAKILTDAIQNAQHRTLQGRTHEVASEALAPVLIEFFRS